MIILPTFNSFPVMNLSDSLAPISASSAVYAATDPAAGAARVADSLRFNVTGFGF